MRVSVDASFVYAMIKNELSASERARAQSALLNADAVHVAMVVLEELFRFSPADSLPTNESRLARYAAIQQSLMTVEVRPITQQVAHEIATLWLVE